MTNKEKFDQVFMECFMVERSALNENLVYQSIDAWDSVGHMTMIVALEEAFNIMMETDDIIDFGSYTRGAEILANYDIVI